MEIEWMEISMTFHDILTGGLKIWFNHNWDNAPE
jgi:hypothetical protein